MTSFTMTNPWIPQIAERPSRELGGYASQVCEYAIDGGTGPFRGFTAFVQIRGALGANPRVEGFLASFRHPEGKSEFMLTKKDLERVEVRTAQDLEHGAAGSPCCAIVLCIRSSAVNNVIRKVVIYPENELAELVATEDAEIGRIYGYYDEVPPNRFQIGGRPM
jgi:hypothetical protein